MKRLLPVLLFAAVFAAPAMADESIPVKPFQSIELRGGGTVTLRHGPAQHVTITDGSSQYTRIYNDRGGKLVIDACNEKCPHIYSLKIEIVTPSIDGVAISGGGEIATAGAFPAQAMLSAAVSGGGDIDMRAVSATRVHAAVSGGGDISVHAQKYLAAAVDGGGDITYWGNPSVTSAINGGGSVDRGS